MKHINDLLVGYENTQLLNYKEGLNLPNTVAFDDIAGSEVTGALKANYHVNGKLMQTYSSTDNHVGVIAATRLGKTTSYVIPTVLSFAKQQKKRSMIISDPKGEVYRYTAATLKSEGYRVRLLNFRDYTHSECWNLLTPIFRKYRSLDTIIDEVRVVDTADGVKNQFRGCIFDDQAQLDEAIDRAASLLYEEVSNDIDTVANMFIETKNSRDTYWEDSARELLKAFLWAMLEDSDSDNANSITEDTYSFSTILSILSNFRDGNSSNYDDDGYFSERPNTSMAYQYAKNCIIENAQNTRKCVVSSFNSRMSVFRAATIRLITSCNSFDISELDDGSPVAIYIDYRDELKIHFNIISLFIQDSYKYLISRANDRPNGKLDIPFYFVLDEFGNFPCIKDFESTISACAGRNIFFILIVQSYAQLNAVYGAEVTEIIRDNLNIHVFFGSNNPGTLKEFSYECGETTRISPLSALNGKSADIDEYKIETIPLVPKSMLSHLQPGECIVTEANCGYVMFSNLERFFLCKEYKDLPLSYPKDYVANVNPFDKKYTYVYSDKKGKKQSPFDF